ncbi:hypothetical protein ACFL96_05185 [Thermoproteota archaeon]
MVSNAVKDILCNRSELLTDKLMELPVPLSKEQLEALPDYMLKELKYTRDYCRNVMVLSLDGAVCDEIFHRKYTPEGSDKRLELDLAEVLRMRKRLDTFCSAAPPGSIFHRFAQEHQPYVESFQNILKAYVENRGK